MKISNILAAKGDFVASVAPATPVPDLLATLADHGIGAVVVRDDDGTLVGIVSERDVARTAHRRGAEVLSATVSEIMTEVVVTCEPAASTAELMELMTERRVRHVPVLEDGQMVGIVSIGDIVKSRLAELETERDALQAYIST